ncbi:hypothetical protein MARBORIA2_07110 [Methanobrevibacter arboriphilus]|uniref:Uncharacterized protein n=1 Tax=Methanobrevibacter arboriphilus TaxID=39441 RepID=A0ACA8R4N8_METAZ|nr:DUF2120 family protein [Methanobrevibacter arboriphilus]MCC7561527.1 DUF2120 domain-containing protein [Methanobrevibacter arboriphilus]BBL62479.1 hypothetical protein MarbSA_15190 [Methanobrevibacter arboriphilus]GLI11621.1 hypothetical protein MARBORIA2_07110 [Methanobrevibacter arboriphilus]
MVKLHKIAGQVMGFFEAFDGSRAALDTDRILIVRGRSSKNISIDDMESKLDELREHLQGIDVDVVSEEAAKLINRMDEQIRASVSVQGDTDSNGIMRMTKSLEAMNLFVKFRLMNLNHSGVFVVTWKDKANVGPLFVEVVVSDDEKE